MKKKKKFLIVESLIFPFEKLSNKQMVAAW